MTTWDHDLAFTMQQQVQSEWCWAATASSVSVFYDPANSPWSQCKIVNAELQQTTCCQNGGSPACNVPWYLDRALTRTQNLSQVVSNSLSIGDLDQELSNGRPMGTRIGWAGGGGHFMVLAGASTTDSRVHIHDPIYGDQDYDYNSYCTSYQGSGTWTHSYYTKSFTNPPVQGGIAAALVPQWARQLFSRVRKHELYAVRPKVTGVNLSHPVFTERLDDLAAGKGLNAATESGWRNISVDESGQPYAEDVEPNLKVRRSISRGPLVSQTFRLIGEAHRQMLSESTTREARFLQIPGIYVFALWLKAQQDEDDLLIPMQPAPAPLRAGDTYHRPDFESIVKSLAQSRLKFDETRGPEH